MLIGIVGTFGSGKGTVVKYLKNNGFSHYSSSGTLKKILEERRISATRKNLSALADELDKEQVGGIMYFLYERMKEDNVDNAMLEAIHRESEADFIKGLGGKILGVDANIKTRYERIAKRQEGEKDNVTFEQFLKDSEREEEGKGTGSPNIRAVMKKADYIIMNNGTLEELHRQIEEILKKLS